MKIKIEDRYIYNINLTNAINFYSFDNYLLKKTLNFTAASTNVFISQQHDPNSFDPGYWRPGAAYFANLPAAILSTAGVVVCTTKVIFQIIAKTTLGIAVLCGSDKAKRWSCDIDISLTMRKLGLFAIGLILQTVGIAIFPLGVLTQAIYFRVLLSLAEIEMKIQFTEMIKEKKGMNPIILTVDDISKVADKIGSKTVSLCASGLAGYTLKQLSNELKYSIKEEHLKEDRTYLEFQIFDYWKDIPIDKVSKRMKSDIQEYKNGIFYSKIEGLSKYRWTIDRFNV